MDSKEFAQKIADQVFNKKAYDVKILDLRKVTTFADYFVICSGDSDTQVKAIADDLDKSLRDEGIKCWHKEGFTALRWVLMDYVDVVVHIFNKEARQYYNIERLWSDAPVTIVEDPALIKKDVKSSSAKRTSKKMKEE